MSNYLCEEVVAEILKRLPVKSLLKFKCVCKSWYSLITNPNFISLHLAHTTESNKTFSFVMKYKQLDYKKPEFVLHSFNDSFSEYKQLDLPSFCQSGNYLRIVGSCNGLVCLYDRINDRLILWNPATGEFITTSLGKICSVFHDIFGFGFDRKNNDYKVVRFVYAGADTTSPPVAEIFELSSNSWKTVTNQNLEYDVYGFGRHIVEWNGIFHWFARVHNGTNKMIASFDLSDEVFHELMLPHALAGTKVYGSLSHLSIIAYNQSLAVVHYDRRMDILTYLRCSIWVMKEYGAVESWTKQITIDLQNHGAFQSVLSFQGNGGILVEDYHGEIASYDPHTQRVTPLGVYGNFFEVHSYTESLVSLKGKRNNNKI